MKHYIYLLAIAVFLTEPAIIRNICARPTPKTSGITYQTYSNWILKCPNADEFVSLDKDRVLDSLKNRIADPSPNDLTNQFTWDKILVRGDDGERFDASKAVVFEGYVVKIKHGDPETCNCNANDKDMEDTHIELAQSDNPDDTARSNRIVVEINPRIRHNKQWVTLKNNDPSLYHKTIKVTGWLAYDYHHRGEAFNTAKNPDSKSIVRATVWEVHPVTHIEIVK